MARIPLSQVKTLELAEQTAKDKENVKAYLSCSLLSSIRAGINLALALCNDIFFS